MTKNILKTPAPDLQLLTDGEAAEMLGIKPRTLRLWRNSRALPHLRLTAKSIRYRRQDLEKWLERSLVVIS